MTTTIARTALLASATAVIAVVLAVVLIDLTDNEREQASSHQQQTDAVSAVLVATTERNPVQRAVARTPAGRAGMLAVHLPNQDPIGNAQASDTEVRAVATDGTASTTNRGAETIRLIPVVLSERDTAVVELRTADTLFSANFGQHMSLLVVAGLAGLALATIIVYLRIRPLASAVRTLARTADTLEPGALPTPLPQRAPDELHRISGALANVAHRWTDLRIDERKLVADLSHRLRTPMTALRLDAEAIEQGALADRVRMSISALEEEVSAVISSSDADVRSETGPGICDLSAVVRDRMTFWSGLASDQGRSCHVEHTTKPAMVRLPGDTVQSVLDALLVNVFRHTAPGTPFAVVVVKHAEWVTLVVDDGGQGIGDPDQALQRGTSSRRSTGLGLDIARKSVEGSGGTIHIERASLGGTRVRLRFPEAGHAPSIRAPRAWRLWGQRRSRLSR